MRTVVLEFVAKVAQVQRDYLATMDLSPGELALVSKASDTLDLIHRKLAMADVFTKRGGRGGGGTKPKPVAGASGSSHGFGGGHEPGAGGQFAPGGGRVRGQGPKSPSPRTSAHADHPAVSAARAKHDAAKVHLTGLTRAGHAGTPAHRQASIDAAKAHEELHAARNGARAEAGMTGVKPGKTPKPNNVKKRISATARDTAEIRSSRATQHLHDLKSGKHAGNETAHIKRTARGARKAELFEAAKNAGIDHGGVKTKKALVEHLNAKHGGKGNGEARPPKGASKPTKPKKPAAKPSSADKPPEYGPSKAKFETSKDGITDHIAESMASKILGKKVSVHDIGTLAGATHDAKFHVSSYGKDHIEIHVESSGYHATRRIIKSEEDGKPIIENVEFKAKETGTGLGREVFGRQVEHASKLGIDRIETHAARSGDAVTIDGKLKGTYIGYAVWPKFGYDAQIPYNLARHKQLPQGAKNVSDLMKTEHGREFWQDYGHGIDMKFDLKAGSSSRKVWDEYRSKKAARA